MDVLTLIVKGNSNKQIAGALGLTEGSIKFYVNKILSKLNVEDRTQAVTTALQRGGVHFD
ncbi:MAG: LuxR C-terminal-related transcriptional regulator [Acidobacteriota bacterium]|nr:LuxR C-terminal-related transcriptional regulator [Acidobacteriota bacterium]